MVPAEAGHRRYTVQKRHVQIEHDGVGRYVVHELDRRQAVRRGRDDRQLTLRLDQLAQRHEEVLVVVGEKDANSSLGGHTAHDSHLQPGDRIESSRIGRSSRASPETDTSTSSGVSSPTLTMTRALTTPPQGSRSSPTPIPT